jgi:hypothetical protein
VSEPCVNALSASGTRYPYFYCLGRQQDTASCQQRYVPVERVEDAVLRHLNSLRMDQSRRERGRGVVLDFFASRSAENAREIRLQPGLIS